MKKNHSLLVLISAFTLSFSACSNVNQESKENQPIYDESIINAAKEVVKKNEKDLDLIKEFNLKDNNKSSLNAYRAISVDENLAADYNCYKAILALEKQINEEKDAYSEYMLSLLDKGDKTYRLYDYSSSDNPSNDFLITLKDKREEKYLINNNEALKSNERTIYYLDKADGYEIYIKNKNPILDKKYTHDYPDTLMDRYYRVIYNDEQLSQVDCATFSNDGQLLKHYFSVYKEEEKVFYVDYAYTIDEDDNIFANDYLQTSLFTNGIAISCDFENRKGANCFPDDLLGSNDRCFWTIQFEDGNNGDIRYFPHDEFLFVGANYVKGWDTYVFEDDFYNSNPLGYYLGWAATSLECGEINAEINKSYFEAYNYLCPVATIGIRDGDAIYPGRLGFAMKSNYKTFGEDSLYSLLDGGLHNFNYMNSTNLELNISDAFKAILDNYTNKDRFNRTVLANYTSLKDLDNWLDNPISDILDPANYINTLIKEVIDN